MEKQVIKSGYVVAIVGRPNVGKSTLFNRIIGQNRAILSNIPGTTRDILYERVTWNSFEFTLADTAGIELDPTSPLEEDILLQTQTAITGADLIIFMADVKTGQQTEDLKAGELIRKLSKPVVLAINKAESAQYDSTVHEFYKLGLGEPIPVSALTGKGIGDILDNIVQQLQKLPKKTLKQTRNEDKIIRVAIMGRPNTGKSTLFNQLAKRKISLVSDIPGTTRDIIKTSVDTGEFKIELTDTAGLRRRGKIDKGIEKFSSLLVIRAVQEADIVLLIVDAEEGILAQDLHIAQIIETEHKGCILVANKWDAVEKNASITSEYEKYLRQKFIFLPWLPILYVSALTGLRTDKIASAILEVWGALNTKIPSKALNNIIGDAYASNSPKGRRKSAKIYFSSQVATNPPTIKLKVNYPEELHFSYLRYLDKALRSRYPLIGAPIKWEITKSSTTDRE